jgi:hypothetical protein
MSHAKARTGTAPPSLSARRTTPSPTIANWCSTSPPPSPSSTLPPLRKTAFTSSRTQLTPFSSASIVSRHPRRKRVKSSLSVSSHTPHTTINRTDLISQAAADADLGSNIRPPTVTRPRHLHATTERHNIVFACFSCILISPYVV